MIYFIYNVSLSKYCLHLLLYIQLFHRIQLLALFFSPCILSLCLSLFIHTITQQSFADDLQLDMSASPCKMTKLFHSMQSNISDVKAWATANILMLSNKAELMHVTSKRTKHICKLRTSITTGNAKK